MGNYRAFLVFVLSTALCSLMYGYALLLYLGRHLLSERALNSGITSPSVWLHPPQDVTGWEWFARLLNFLVANGKIPKSFFSLCFN